jgi:CHAT domain-containing protein
MPRKPISGFAIFASPSLGVSNLPPLSKAIGEADTISLRLSSLKTRIILTKGEATKEAFAMASQGKSILHVITHGAFPTGNAGDMHYLFLAPSRKADGKLYAAEIKKMQLHDCRLAVLSVCDGGLYRVGPADEPYGLIPAFLTAGVENVMGSIWPIEDNAAAVFMSEFYKHLLADGPAIAYQKACKEMIGEDDFLGRWAGFVIVGSGTAW